MDPVADHYLVEKVTSASPAELIGLLYDKAVLNLKRAKTLSAAGDWERAHGRIVNASDIVLELRCVLNPAAGDMTVRLEALYAWVTQQLLIATSRRDGSGLDEALAVLTPLQTAWRQACIGGVRPVAAVLDGMTAWTPLLDRLEERLRRIEQNGRTAPGSSPVELGPEPVPGDRPAAVPTADELLRLHMLLAAHDQLEGRLRERRSVLQRAERYSGQAG